MGECSLQYNEKLKTLRIDNLERDNEGGGGGRLTVILSSTVFFSRTLHELRVGNIADQTEVIFLTFNNRIEAPLLSF